MTSFDRPDDYGERRRAWLEAWRLQVRVVAALVRRETRAHFGETRMGYLWAIVEPTLHLIGYVILFGYILGRHVPVGGSLTLFMLTGLVPYFLYMKQAVYLAGAVAGNKPLLNLPPVKPFDVFVSRGILEASTYLFVGAIMLIALILAGNTDAIPRNPIVLAEAILLVVFFGMGLGMVNAVMQTFIPTWTTMFTLVMGPLYLLSGVWFIPQEIPPPFRGYLLINPVMHFIMWFRAGFYPNDVATYLDRGYAISASVGVFVLGLALQRVMRRKLLEPI